MGSAVSVPVLRAEALLALPVYQSGTEHFKKKLNSPAYKLITVHVSLGSRKPYIFTGRFMLLLNHFPQTVKDNFAQCTFPPVHTSSCLSNERLFSPPLIFFFLQCLTASTCLSVCISVFLSVCLSVFLSFCLSVFLSVCLPACVLCFCVSVFLSVCVSVFLSIRLSIRLLVSL